MDGLSANWIWIVLAIGTFLLFRRMGVGGCGMGGCGMGCCGMGDSARSSQRTDSDSGTRPDEPHRLF